MLKVGDRIERNLGLVFEEPDDLSGCDVVEVLLSTVVGGKPGSVNVTVRGTALAVPFLVEAHVDDGAFEIAKAFYWQLEGKVLKGADPEHHTALLRQVEDLAEGLRAFLDSGVVAEFTETMRPLQPAELWKAGQIGFLVENREQLEAACAEAVADFNSRLAA